MQEIFPLTIAEYAQQAAATDKYLPTQRLQCCALGLISEVGELAGKVDKHYRKTGEFSPDDDERLHMAKELGDILWFATESLRCTTADTQSYTANQPSSTAAPPASISKGRVTPDPGHSIPERQLEVSHITLPSIMRDRSKNILFAISNRPPSFDLDTFVGYQQVILLSHSAFPTKHNIVNLVFSMSSFVNEYIAFVRQAIANGEHIFDRVDSDIVSDYLADLIAVITECAMLIGYTIEDIASINLQKLADRDRRNQIASIEGGDDR